MAIRAKKMTSAEALITMQSDHLLTTRTVIPGIVKKVNVVNGSLITIDADVVIYNMVTDDTGLKVKNEAIPTISNIPFVVPWGKTAGLLLSVPVNVGDDVLLLFADRSIDNWQSTGKMAAPAEDTIPRTHDLTDAIAIPGIFNNVTAKQVVGYDNQAIELRDTSNKVSIKVTKNAAIIRYEGNTVTIDSGSINSVCGGSTVSMTDSSVSIAATNITLTGNVTIAGDSFNLASTSSTTSGGDLVTSGGVNIGSHVHTDPQGGTTGGPQN